VQLANLKRKVEATESGGFRIWDSADVPFKFKLPKAEPELEG
jgi:hypothetical protein